MRLFRLICFLNAIIATKCYVTLIAEELNDGKNFTCVLEGNSSESAVTWNVPIEYYLNPKASHYFPDSEILCNYTAGKTNSERCIPTNWSINRAVDFHFKPIVDYRWERFPITTFSKSDRKHLFEFSNTSFNVILSFRIKNNATLYLCSSYEIEGVENCFGVIITKTVIRIYSHREQEELLNTMVMNDELEEDSWTNLIIRHRYINKRRILKIKIANVSCTGKIEASFVKGVNLSVRSEELSLWKVHDYWFLSTTKVVGAVQIQGKISIAESKQPCVSLYVALCTTCIMTITLQTENETVHPTKVENLNINDEQQGGPYSWQEIKIITNTTAKTFKIYLLVNNTNGSTDGFWAIDNLRSCDTKEIRISNLFLKDNLKKSIQCQPLQENPVSINNPIDHVGCEDSKIGANCNITCEYIFGANKKYCERKLICDQSSECYCAIGYKGSTCKNECDKGSWGSRCKNQCANCKNNHCHPVTGSCSKGCKDGFAPPSCTNLTTVKKIRQTNATSISITIEWDFPSAEAFSYIVIYKHKRYLACNDNQKDTKQYNFTVNNRKAVIDKLLPYSEYYLQVAAKFNNIQGNFTNLIASTSYTNTPNNEEGPIEIRASHQDTGSFPLIIISEPRCSNIKGPLEYEAKFNCSEEWCNDPTKPLSFNYTNGLNSERNFTKSVNHLIPYSNYVVTITPRRTGEKYNMENILEIKFQTRESKPPKVTNLMAYSRSENSISLRWKTPYPPHGKIEKYTISCTGINPCTSLKISPKPCELWEGNFTCANVTNLINNKNYTVKVSANNYGVNLDGVAEYQSNVLTQENESEPPLNVKAVWKDKDTVKLHWEHPFITNGPLIYFAIKINVIKSEYSNRASISTNFIIEKYNRTYSKVLDLHYSSEYNVAVYGVNKFKGKPSKNVTIKMPPPTPKFVYSPTLNKCEITHLKYVNISESSYLYVIVETIGTAQEEQNITQLLIDSARNGKNKTNWLAIAMPVKHITDDVVLLGDGTNTTSFYGIAVNKPLFKDTDYRVTVILANYFLTKTRFSETYPLYSKERIAKVSNEVQEAHITTFSLYALFLLLLIPIAVCGWILYNKRNNLRNGKNCFQESSTPSEDLVLRQMEISRQVKPVGIVKPTDLVDVTSPLLSQEDNEGPKYTCEVKLEYLEEYVKQSIGTDEDGELVRQHKLFVRGQTNPWDYGLRKENRFKNRYNNLIAYDHSRVKLEKINNDEFSDYINANYINGYKQPKGYIATQGPKPTTVCDFWRMVWQERATTIVMVANVEEDGKKKTEEYWPKLNCPLTFGAIEVHHQKSEIYSNYVFRTLMVTKGEEERTIEQLHFTSWPDHGVPLYPQTLVPFIEKVRTVRQDIAPIIVHCSAGVGRTGTIILCDYILRMADGEGAVDFLATLQEMREQRANLVDSPNQYKLAHLVVLETLFGLNTTFQCDYELEQKINTLISNNELLYTQMEYLEKIIWQDQTMWSSYKSIPNPANKKKDRFSNIVPDGYGHVYMTRYPVTDEHSDYINAVAVDGFHVPKRFIVTQQPLPGTVSDFWRMVFEKDACTIVSLNDIEPCDASSCTFWPEGDKTLDLDFALVKYVEKEEYTTHDNIKLILISKVEGESNEYGRNINMVKMKGWPPLKVIPDSLEALMETWNESDKVSRGSNPVVVTCYDGAKASGVFVALSFVIEKMKLEQICDVCLAVRTVRYTRKEFVTNVEQFQLLYEAAVEYLKSFETYSNFPKTNK